MLELGNPVGQATRTASRDGHGHAQPRNVDRNVVEDRRVQPQDRQPSVERQGVRIGPHQHSDDHVRELHTGDLGRRDDVGVVVGQDRRHNLGIDL